jgi:RNA helicase.
MPKGKPASGKRKYNAARPVGRPRTKVDEADLIVHNSSTKKPKTTDQQIADNIKERFAIMVKLIDTVVLGDARALIISGPPGCGKTFTVEERMKKLLKDNSFEPVRGYSTRTGLYSTFYKYRHPGDVVVFDDTDVIFTDTVALNLLKAACDTCPVRTMTYLSKCILTDDAGLTIPSSFHFQGSVIFITNLDFDQMVAKKSKLSTHISALMSRANYVDLAMPTRREALIRIRQVCITDGMLKKLGLTSKEQTEVLNFISDNEDRMRELTLREVIKIATLRKEKPKEWVRLCQVTCLKPLHG